MCSRWLAYALVLLAPMVLGYGCKSESSDPQPQFIQILDFAPSDRDTEVPVEARIGFRIDGAIDPASLTEQTFLLTDEDGALVPSSIFVGDEPGIAELDPDSPLEVITTYTVTITTGLMATDGRTLEEDFTWEFTTLDSAWGTPEWLEQIGTGTSSRAQVLVDAQSNALAIWQYSEETGNGIWANHYTRTDLWEEPEPIDDGNGASTKPALAIDDDGNGFAVWERSEDGGSTTNIWTNRYDVSQGWGTAELLQNGQVTTARSHSVAADAAGNAIAVWVQRDMDTSQDTVWAIRYEPQAGWGAARSIDPPRNTLVATTAVGMDGSGNAVMVWSRQDQTFPGDVIWANRYTAGVGWESDAAEIIADVDSNVRGLRLAVAPNGDAFVVWVGNDLDSTRDDILSARFSGSSWGPTERIDTYDLGNKMEPDIAAYGEGMAHAVWSQADDDFENIYAGMYTPGSGWGTPQLIEPPNADPNQDGDASNPRVGVNAAGNTFAVWTQIREGWPSTWSNRLDPGAGWMTAEPIEEDMRAAKAPAIAVDSNRHAHAVWLQNRDLGFDWVRTNRFE